ncbi:MAG: YqgE/AlgH family protein [Rhodospirillales bacterium]|jgi:putative transcriptional regulator
MARTRIEIPTFFAGHLLVAMPSMSDSRFERSVIYMCAHNPDGAMGLVINRPFEQMSFPDLLEQLEIPSSPRTRQILLRSGGPVESGRGFVLHSDDYMHDGSMRVMPGIALTATIDILKALAIGDGPQRSLLALGCAGWSAGQLEGEIQRNGWLTVPTDADLVFDQGLDTLWQRAIGRLGVDLSRLSGEAGHA